MESGTIGSFKAFSRKSEDSSSSGPAGLFKDLQISLKCLTPLYIKPHHTPRLLSPHFQFLRSSNLNDARISVSNETIGSWSTKESLLLLFSVCNKEFCTYTRAHAPFACPRLWSVSCVCFPQFCGSDQCITRFELKRTCAPWESGIQAAGEKQFKSSTDFTDTGNVKSLN